MNSQLLWLRWGMICVLANGMHVLATTLYPSPAEVFENESLTLILSFFYTEEYISSWEINSLTVGFIAFKKQQCIVAGTLNNSALYYVSCNNTSTSITIKTVELKMHGDIWGASLSSEPSTTTALFVKVPVGYVYISSSMMQENTIISMNETDVVNIACRSSYGRPAPSLLVFTSKDNIMEKQLFLPNETSYYINNNNLIQTNTIFLFNASRVWNGWSMFCKASNRPQTEVQSQSVKLDIMFTPKNGPFIANLAKGIEYAIVENNTGMMICSVDESNPPAKLSWNCTTQETVTVTSLNETCLSIQWFALRNKISMCKCTSTHILIKPTSVSVDVNVLYPPEFILVNLTMDKTFAVNITSNFSVIENTIISLICSADGKPVASNYSWSGISFSYSSELLLTANRNGSGFVSCQASNEMKAVPANNTTIGTKMKSYFMQVLYPPEILMLNDKKVIEGDDFSITCFTKPGNPETYRFIWLNGENKHVQNGNKLTLTNVSRHKHGNYTCELSYELQPTYGNNHTGAMRTIFNLDVLYPPEIITVSLHMGQFKKYNVSRNFSVIEDLSNVLTLNCSASGNPSPDIYYWSGRQNSANSLLSFNLRKDLSGSYTCHAWNQLEDKYGARKDATITESFNVYILYPPEIEDMSKFTLEAEEGHPLNVSCKVRQGNETHLSLSWFRNEGKFQTNTSVLSFPSIMRNDTGTYTCNMTYALAPTYGGTIIDAKMKSLTIDVLYRAAVSMFYFSDYEQNLTVIVNENETVKMICEVDSNPGSTMELFMNDVLVRHTTQEKKLDYVIHKSTCNHIGTYTCYGFNLLNKGVKSMKSLQLFVTCFPRPLKFALPVKNITSAQHVSVTFSLSVMAYPEPSFNFYRLNGSTLVPIGNDVIENQTIISPGISQINITLEQVTVSHFGHYVLNISNALGYYQQRFQLTPKGSVTTRVASGITGPAIGGAVGGTLAIFVVVLVLIIIKKRFRDLQPLLLNKASDVNECHTYQNISRGSDCNNTSDNDCSAVYERLQNRVSGQEYQHLTTFAHSDDGPKVKVYENLRITFSNKNSADCVTEGQFPRASTQSQV